MRPTDFPLCWPEGQERTPPSERIRSPYRRSFQSAYDALCDAAERFHDKDCEHDVVISTCIPLSGKGMPLVSVASKVGDPAVAVYLWHEGRPYALAHDEFREVRENLNALAYTLEGYFLIAKHASARMQRRSMVGFQQQIVAAEPAKMITAGLGAW